MIDLFCSNGSTWYNKKYFLNDVMKNDIRKGKYVVGSNLFNQVIDIKPDTQYDVLNSLIDNNEFRDNVVYLDPPHLIGVKSGIMYEKYTSLDNLKQIEMLAINCNKISDKFLIIKWADNDVDIESFLNYFRPYFIDTIRFGDRKKKNTSWLIIMIKKQDDFKDDVKKYFDYIQGKIELSQDEHKRLVNKLYGMESGVWNS